MQFDKVRYLLGWKDGDIVTAIKNKGFETKIMSEAQLSYSILYGALLWPILTSRSCSNKISLR